MICGAAGNDVDLLKALEVLVCEACSREVDLIGIAVGNDNGIKCILNCLGLLVDLLHHEVLKTALFS